MPLRFETDQIRKHQAALEAVQLLDDRGFIVEDFSIESEANGTSFSLDVDLIIPEYERPLVE